MKLFDPDLVRILEARDGPLGSRWRPHRRDGACAYPALYPDGACPWCQAELNREASGAPPPPQRAQA